MNPGLGTTLLLIFKPLQDEWATKGHVHTHRNELLNGTIQRLMGYGHTGTIEKIDLRLE